jgi:protein-tyrosine phosphatase
MRRIGNLSLWIGHASDVRDMRLVLASGILAVVDLAMEEPPPVLARDLVVVRIPLVDGPGNPRWRLQEAIDTVSRLISARIPTLVGCGAGMSRSPCIVGMALARVLRIAPQDALAQVLETGRSDISPGLWAELRELLVSPPPGTSPAILSEPDE